LDLRFLVVLRDPKRRARAALTLATVQAMTRIGSPVVSARSDPQLHLAVLMMATP